MNTAVLSSITRILVPVDFSGQSLQALRWADRLRAGLGAELVMLHVIDFGGLPDGYLGISLDKAGARRAAEERLGQWLRQEFMDTAAVSALVEEGQAATTIAGTARQLSCGLIVIATHGQGGVAHDLVGSTTEQVVRKAPCPVVAYRPRRWAGPADTGPPEDIA